MFYTLLIFAVFLQSSHLSGFGGQLKSVVEDPDRSCKVACQDRFIQHRSVCGQSYKHFTLINYDSRVVPDWKIPHIKTLES